MEAERLHRVQKTTRLHLAMEAEDVLAKIRDFPDNPRAMEYFYERFHQRFANEPAAASERPLIGTMCVQVPEELIRAAGAIPVRLCSGANAHDQVGAEFLPAKSCPVTRATLGMLHIQQDIWGKALATIVIPTTCDQKRKGGEILADMGYKVTFLEMPPSKETAAGRFYWQESVKKFALGLERLTGHKLTKKKLAAAVVKTSAAAGLFRRLHALRRAQPPLILGKDIFMVLNAYSFDDPDRWQEAVARLIAELEERQQQKITAGQRHAPRLLFTGSPPIFPNIKVPLLMEQAGGVIVADEVCSSSRLLADAVAYDEARLNEMVPAIADRYLKPCTCPCLTPNNDRFRRLRELVASHAVDGVVYQAFSGCMPYELEQRLASRAMAEQGVPMLYLETDYSREDLGQLSTRIEAFIESLKARRRKSRGKKRSAERA
jgi:benzoyl-CoA reductase/2-hydroxyglutaryl-CoA dehydratase subunit BcrC/BadD/HgdB